jgi:chromosome segregation ATPase
VADPWVQLVPIAVALAPWVGAWALKRFRPAHEATESEQTRLAAERKSLRDELREDLDALRRRVDELEAVNQRLRENDVAKVRHIAEQDARIARQARRITVLERALRDAQIPIPEDWETT